jgi:hypothetical protein
MSQSAYSPMHPPRKEVTQEDMWETLKRHLPSGSSLRDATSPVGESPKEKLRVREPLVWLEHVKTGKDTGYVLTQCGRFSVAKVLVYGRPMYHAFKVQVIAGRREYPQTGLGVRLTPEEAKHLCELENERESSSLVRQTP